VVWPHIVWCFLSNIIRDSSIRVISFTPCHLQRCVVKVSAGRFSIIVGYLEFVQRGYDLTASLALLPIICIVAACLLTVIVFCMRKSRPFSTKQKSKSLVDISYVHVPGSSVLPSLSQWPLRQQPSPLLSRQ